MYCSTDRRDDMAGSVPATVCENTMTMEIEYTCDETDEEITVRMPFKWSVCSTCGGKGSHVNPAIDAHGITESEFAEDPDFREEYFNGAYDEVCYECQGKRVVPVLHAVTDEQRVIIERVSEQAAEEADYRVMCETERRMGC
jgi:hypothetical protein